MRLKILLLPVFFALFSCSSKIDSESYSVYQKEGNKISGMVQATLLKNVGEAIQKGGPQYAVEFCNLNASSLIDSLNGEYKCIINRVTDKNRNPDAALNTTYERELWRTFQTTGLKDTLIMQDRSLVYYKPIKIGMPACLKCHGIPGQDINTATRQKLQQLYPKDLATGYTLEDFRGLWKIEFDIK